jgi:hypothetical protein
VAAPQPSRKLQYQRNLELLDLCLEWQPCCMLQTQQHQHPLLYVLPALPSRVLLPSEQHQRQLLQAAGLQPLQAARQGHQQL